ncbi:protoporphyrinogen oxidase [Streptacidiphilus sp. PB12-B1b]|uniref:protoporphyrinogen oxidase n=1 Tax=Streptacidiphilus sp. PB12-B1b TaxID=2705012 RepID=UPI0015F8D8BF|nr:protoporphyrinogen oxidase [Streptacidiphilus sp. PB12-B1b]QMU78642.1 protoporphyrinogen oxidase [Streptacidiphilus sp. PB12-B1b]
MHSSTTAPAHRALPHVVVVGGGIAGLAAAARLSGADGEAPPAARVTLVEAGPRLGGKLHASALEGIPVDLGAESVLARRPEALRLARAVGLGEALQPPTTARAAIWTRGALRPMPARQLMGVPADLDALAASGVLSAQGLARVAEEPSLPPTEVGADVSVGGYVAARVGREVVERLVEPLLGGVYAGNADRISMRMAVPQLLAVAQRGGSLTEGVRALLAAAPADPGPVFTGIDGGIGRLPLAVADACRAAGVELLTGTPVTGLRRTPDGWSCVAGGRRLEADAVVLAVPAPAAAALLADQAPAVAAELAGIEYAGMALVTLAFRRSELAVPEGSGFLVPPVDGQLIKASTFSSNKWGWLAAAAPDSFVLRTSVGRHGEEGDLDRDDADLVAGSLAALGAAAGITARPYASTVTRWRGGLPQYPVGHADTVERIGALAAALPGLALCGAAYQGVGIPACIGSGWRAADLVRGALGAEGTMSA